MDTSEYNGIKQEILDRPVIYRELEAKEVLALGDNFYNFGNTTVQVEPEVAGKIDNIAGIMGGQTRIAYDNYGDQGVTKLRNFFGQATKNNRIVVAADTQSKQIVDIIPLKDKLITPYAFFNFMEMYMDKNQYYPERVEYTDGGNKVSVIIKPEHEEYMEYFKDDEFLSNALFFMWTPSEIVMGNYYIRLVCTNGSTRIIRNSIAKITSPIMSEFRKVLCITSDSDPFKENLDTMLESAKIAKKTNASVNELKSAVNLLIQQGLDNKDANEIIPYESTKAQYEEAGYPMIYKTMIQAKSDKTMWEVFNMLTYFATHNKLWSPHDIRRSSLMESSMGLLLKKRDIKDYYDIF